MKIYSKPLTALASAIVLGTSMSAQANDGGVVFDPNSNTVTFMCADLDTDDLRYVLEEYVDFANDVTDPGTGDVTGKDRDGLEGKLAQADAKLLESNFCDAAQKVDDFGSKVSTLKKSSSPEKLKISDDFGGQAIDCLIIGAGHLAEDLLSGQSCEDAGDPPRGNGKGKGPNK